MNNQIHPYLFAIFPLLCLFCTIAGESPVRVVMLPLLAVCALAMLMRGVFSLICQDLHKGALLSSLFMLLFITHGSIRNILAWGGDIVTSSVLADCLVFALSLALLVLAAWLLNKTRIDLTLITKFATISGVVLVAGALLMVWFCSSRSGPETTQGVITEHKRAFSTHSPLGAITPDMMKTAPDIYCILLSEINNLAPETGQQQNDSLTRGLVERGFYIADQSHWDYLETDLYFASLLNMSYLDSLADKIKGNRSSRRHLTGIINNNLTRHLLEPVGYRFVSFATGEFATELRSANYFLSPGYHLDRFQAMVLANTMIPRIQSLFQSGSGAHQQSRWNEYALNHLGDATDLGVPIFTFAHLTADRSEIAAALMQAIDNQCLNTDRPLVIIVQNAPLSPLQNKSGESPAPPVAFLNAIYFSDHNHELLYPAMTPVNTLRVTLNHFLEADLPLLGPSHNPAAR